MNDSERARYVEMSVLCDRILLMMDEAKSTYAGAMGYMREARGAVLIQPEKAVRLTRKAFSAVEEEYALVSEFNKTFSAFPVNIRSDSGGEVAKIETGFRDSIRNGKFHEARKWISKLRESADDGNYRKFMTISVVDNNVRDGKVELIITNTTDKDLIIAKTEVASFDAVSSPLLLPNKVLKAKSQMTVPICFTSIREGASLISVSMWYEVDFDSYEEVLSVKVFNGAKDQ